MPSERLLPMYLESRNPAGSWPAKVSWRHQRSVFRIDRAILPLTLPSLPSCLSSEATSLPSNTMWVSAAFFHFAAQQQADHEGKGEVLKRLGPKAEQVSSFSFHFQEENLRGEFWPNASLKSAAWGGRREALTLDLIIWLRDWVLQLQVSNYCGSFYSWFSNWQFLAYVLFFSVMDFISAKVAPEASSASILAGWDGEMKEGQVTVKPTLA